MFWNHFLFIFSNQQFYKPQKKQKKKETDECLLELKSTPPPPPHIDKVEQKRLFMFLKKIRFLYLYILLEKKKNLKVQ